MPTLALRQLVSSRHDGDLRTVAALVGLVIGIAIVGWIVGSIVPETFPELETSVVLTARTLLVAGAIGVVACALSPLFTTRRLRRMDVASTLRVME